MANPQHLTNSAPNRLDNKVRLHLRYSEFQQPGTRCLIIKYPVMGTRRSHLMAMEERAKGLYSARFREYIDSKQRQCVVILDLPVQDLEFTDKNTRTLLLRNNFEASLLHNILRLGCRSGRYIKDIPRKMKRDQWATVCELPMRQATGSGRVISRSYYYVPQNQKPLPSRPLPQHQQPHDRPGQMGSLQTLSEYQQMLTYHAVGITKKKEKRSWLTKVFSYVL